MVFVSAACLVLYVCVFASFRLCRTFTIDKALPEDPFRRVVIFSVYPTAQEIARSFFWPLIQLAPGRRSYPTGEQMEVIGQDPQSPTGRLVLWW